MAHARFETLPRNVTRVGPSAVCVIDTNVDLARRGVVGQRPRMGGVGPLIGEVMGRWRVDPLTVTDEGPVLVTAGRRSWRRGRRRNLAMAPAQWARSRPPPRAECWQNSLAASTDAVDRSDIDAAQVAGSRPAAREVVIVLTGPLPPEPSPGRGPIESAASVETRPVPHRQVVGGRVVPAFSVFFFLI